MLKSCIDAPAESYDQWQYTIYTDIFIEWALRVRMIMTHGNLTQAEYEEPALHKLRRA